MKKSTIILLLSLLFLPFISRAQSPMLNIPIFSSHCESSNNFEAATGCEFWISNSMGDTLYLDVIPLDTWSWDVNLPYNSAEAPYFVNFDSTCLIANGVSIDNYSLQAQDIHPVGNNFWADSVFICQDTGGSSGDLYFEVGSNLCNPIYSLDPASGCDYFVINSTGDTVLQDIIPSPTTNNWIVNLPYNSAEEPYSIVFDSICLNTNSVTLNNYSFQVQNIQPSGGNYWGDSIIVCSSSSVIPDTYSVMMLTESCDSLISAPSNSLAANCGYWVEDINGTTVYQNNIGDIGSEFLLGGFSFPYDASFAPYVLHFDETCLNNNGIGFGSYSYPLNATGTGGTTIFDEIIICTEANGPIEPDTCIDLTSSVGPYIGYYQNYTNYIRFTMGNNSNVAQSVNVEIVIPPGVTPVTSSFDFPYVVSGSLLTLNTTIPPLTAYYDVIKFDVPGAISDGTLHTYGIFISNNDTTAIDCLPYNNQDTLHQVVGNSYDPNAKTVNKSREIAADVQDELFYTIYFQNTGTAPAQDVYLIDTLSENLDWSTFEFLKSSHVVGISDLGNGVKKFYFDGIWLPDSTTSFAESNGFVSFKIKEKASNSVGSEIKNTAYIYFDHNPAIVTNTTYNINVDHLSLEEINKEINVKLYPNPANEFIQIEGSSSIDKIEVYSVEGKLCFTSEPHQSEVKLDISNFNSGLYIVKIESNESAKTLRFVKK